MNETEQINYLKDKVTTLDDLFNANPFDQRYDWNGDFTEEIFYAQCFVEHQEFKELSEKLIQGIEDKVYPHRVFSLNGFSGNGKTTFIRYFMKQNQQYQHVYYDFQEKHSEFQEDQTNQQVISMLSRAMRKGFQNDDDECASLIATISFMVDEQETLKENTFITLKVYDELRKIKQNGKIGREEVNQVLDEFQLLDTFTCFFINLFSEHRPQKKKTYFF